MFYDILGLLSDNMKETCVPNSVVSDATSAFFEHLGQLKKWQEEQVQKLRSMQKTQWAQLQEGQKRMDNLLKQGIETKNEPQCGFRSKEPVSLPEVQKNQIPKHIDDFDSAKQDLRKQSKNEKAVGKSEPTSSILKTQVVAKPCNQSDVSEMTVTGLGTSFEEAIKTQMEKLLADNGHQQGTATEERKPVVRKQKFLKKGEGLRRFQPQKISYPKTNQSQGRKVQSTTRNCNTKDKTPFTMSSKPKDPVFPSKKNKSDPPKNNRCVRFNDPMVLEKIYLPPTKKNKPKLSAAVDNFSEEEEKVIIDPKVKEFQELAEFEILEHRAENSSFSSDSSFLESIDGDGAKISFQVDKVQQSLESLKVGSSNGVLQKSSIPLNGGSHVPKDSSNSKTLSNYIAELQACKKELEQQLSNYQDLPDSSTLDNLISQQEVAGSYNMPAQPPVGRKPMDAVSNSGSESVTSGLSSLGDDINAAVIAMHNSDQKGVRPPFNHKDEISDSDQKSSSCSMESGVVEDHARKEVCEENENDSCQSKSKLIKKLKELEEEINIYRDNNKKVALLIKEKEDEIKALQKNRQDFEKFSKDEKAKIESEITAQRMQIRREKQTFERYRKLSRELPGRKEREENGILRQRITKLQEELKKHNIKSNAESKRLRKLLADAEKERDCLKFENERLENQCSDLLSALKACANKECSCKTVHSYFEKQTYPDYDEPRLDDDPKIKKICADIIGKSSSEDDVSECGKNKKTKSKMSKFIENDSELEKTIPKQRVRFNLEPDIQNYSPEINANANDYHEIQRDDRTEKIFKTGETEITYQSGTTKYISADGLHIKFNFYNGDTKEIFPDKRVVYTFADCTVETHYPDGMVQYEFPDFRVEKHFSDGRKIILLPDKTQSVIFPDGTEETHYRDGTVTKYLPDRTEIVDYPSGEREIRTDDYRKRVYPDGTVRTLYESGRMETHYSNGRIKIKDKTGKVIVDTQNF